MTKALKICDCCKRTFRPQFSDEEVRELFLSESQLDEYNRFKEMWDEEPQIRGIMFPFQTTCEKCLSKPNDNRTVTVNFTPSKDFLFQDMVNAITKRQKKESAIKRLWNKFFKNG